MGAQTARRARAGRQPCGIEPTAEGSSGGGQFKVAHRARGREGQSHLRAAAWSQRGRALETFGCANWPSRDAGRISQYDHSTAGVSGRSMCCAIMSRKGFDSNHTSHATDQRRHSTNNTIHRTRLRGCMMRRIYDRCDDASVERSVNAPCGHRPRTRWMVLRRTCKTTKWAR